MKRQKSNISQHHVISSNVTRKSILRRIEGSWNVNSIFRQKCFVILKLKKFIFFIQNFYPGIRYESYDTYDMADMICSIPRRPCSLIRVNRMIFQMLNQK